MILINPNSKSNNRSYRQTTIPIGSNLIGIRADDVLISLRELDEAIKERSVEEVMEYILRSRCILRS